MEAEKAAQEQDPLETGAVAWQERAQLLAAQWAVSPELDHGVAIEECMEYAIVDALNHHFAAAND